MEACAAIQLLDSLLAKPTPQDEEDVGCPGFFAPWDLFPAVYGSYSSDFDDMAICVLEKLRARSHSPGPEPLAEQMFREMLCTADLCDYGTSPRVCFPTPEFKERLPLLIERWKAYRAVAWRE